MAVRTKKYTNQGREFRGVKVTEKNYSSVAMWAGGLGIVSIDKKGKESKHRVRLHTKNGIRVATAKDGDFIVKDSEKNFFVIKAKQFEEDFELAA